jgi:hypothetical protein
MPTNSNPETINPNNMREELIERIYEVLGNLATKKINNGYKTLAEPIPKLYLQAGLYFFFDHNIQRINGIGNKVVRIGISGENGNNRLGLHKNGNIESSIFRKHVGRALANSNNGIIDDIQISNYIHKLPYLFLPVLNNIQLHNLEKNLIQIISNYNQSYQIDIPPNNWLGYQQGPNINPAISSSHLWNVHYVKNFNGNNKFFYDQTLIEFKKLINSLP